MAFDSSMTPVAACPTLADLAAGSVEAHSPGCPTCRASLALAATVLAPDACGMAETLIAARMIAPLSSGPEGVLIAHLRSCTACFRVARDLESSETAAMLTAGDSVSDFDTLRVVGLENYVRGAEIGRGGMGHIVLARDRRLGRAVAIKELLDSTMGRLFEREARLTARLQHPAIVSVYEAGAWPSGEPFYAMKHVVGRRLDEVVAGKRTLDERLGLLPNLAAVADAIAYAHSEGVIHRDLKPQNILIGAFGETVVIDWGLAKDLRGPAEPGTLLGVAVGALTVGGAGTPAYMSPEQARGEPPDERVDVYGLGATLHHVLAGSVPGTSQLPDETPRELRAIIAKATARDRNDRYPSADELARDLRSYVAGKLVAAHRYTTRERLARFWRRHRPLVTLSAAFLVVLTILGVVSLRRIVAERDQSRAAQAEAVAQRRGAERLVDYLLGTLRPRLNKVGKLELLEGVGKEVEAYYASVPAADEHDANVLFRRAGALEALGQVDFNKAKIEDARRETGTRLRLCQEAYALLPTPDAADCRVASELRLGTIAMMTGDQRLAIRKLDDARNELASVAGLYPRDRALRLEGVTVARYLGRAFSAIGDLEKARVETQASVALAERLVADYPGHANLLRQLAESEADLGTLEARDGHPERALAPFERAADHSAAELQLEPESAVARMAWALNTGDVATAAIDFGDPTLARTRLVAAIPVMRALVDRDPDNSEWRNQLGFLMSLRCQTELAAGQVEATRTACREAIALWGAILDKQPDHDAAAENLVLCHFDLSLALAGSDLASAADGLAKASALIESHLAKGTVEPDWQALGAEVHARRAHLARLARKFAEARAQAHLGLALAVSYAAVGDALSTERVLAVAMFEAAVSDAHGGDYAAAEARLREALARLDRAAARWPGPVDIRERLAAAAVELSDVLARRGVQAEVTALRQRALALIGPLEASGALDAEFADLPRRAAR